MTSLQALAARVPVLTHRCLPGHGRANAAGLDQAGLAAWVRDPGRLPAMLGAVLSGHLASAQNAAAARLFRGPEPAEVIVTLASLANAKAVNFVPSPRPRVRA